MIYQSIDTVSDKTNIMYLTPIKLQWALEANPIYYYYVLFDKNNLLYLTKSSDSINKTIDIINMIRPYYSRKSLIEYTDRMNNPTISNIIHREILSGNLDQY